MILFRVSCVNDSARTNWPGFIKCYLVDGATLLLPTEVTAAACS